MHIYTLARQCISQYQTSNNSIVIDQYSFIKQVEWSELSVKQKVIYYIFSRVFNLLECGFALYRRPSCTHLAPILYADFTGE